MKRLSFALAALALGTGAYASPTVSDVALTQEADRTVRIAYTLTGEQGIVTVDIRTNGVSIGGALLSHFAGDVNRLVQPGARSMTWQPHRAWPDNGVSTDLQAVVTAWATNAPPDYLVVSLVCPNSVRFFADAASVPGGVTNDLYKTDELVLRRCHAENVEWRMGSPVTPEELGRTKYAASEMPHMVTLTSDYYLAVYELTQRQYERIFDQRAAFFSLDSDYPKRPIENVPYGRMRGTWNDASGAYYWPRDGHTVASSSVIGKLRAFSGVTGFDLPTEAQWEFACRAGTGSALYTGEELAGDETSANLADLARYAATGGLLPGGSQPTADATAEYGTAIVGSYEPNAWGFYDMYGNVSEMCLDWYVEDNTAVDPETGPATSTGQFVRRSCNFTQPSRCCRSAARSGRDTSGGDRYTGYRLACSINLK